MFARRSKLCLRKWYVAYADKSFNTNFQLPKQQRDAAARGRETFEKQLYVRSGHGGNGLARYNGIGGCGGFVYARPNSKLTFGRFCADFSSTDCARKDNDGGDGGEEEEEEEGIVDEEERRRRAVTVGAENGDNARQTRLAGRHGSDRILEVPIGVEIVGENNVLLARCSSPKKLYLLAKGGMGGCGHNKFIGEPGEAFWATVNLKLCPNVGLIGLPNAGKSTLMRALVPNKFIKIAPYPFTTTTPQLCYIKYKEAAETREGETEDDICTPFTLSIADLPGIVEGASRNRFNAYNCLKHLEYSDVIVMVVDVHGFQLGPNEPHRSPIEMMALLNREMEQYDRALVRKPVVLVLNKVDMADGEKKANALCEFLLGDGRDGLWPQRLAAETGDTEGALQLMPNYPINFRSVHAISAKQGRLGNVKTMLRRIHRELGALKPAQFDNVCEDWSGKKRKLC